MTIAENMYEAHCVNWTDETIDNLWDCVDYVDRTSEGDLYTYMDGSRILVKGEGIAEIKA